MLLSPVVGSVSGTRPGKFWRHGCVRFRGHWWWCFLLVPGWLSGAVQAETWTDSTGAFRVEADFLGLRGDEVWLKKANGVTIRVPLVRLSVESQQKARQMAWARKPQPAAGTTDASDAAIQAVLDQLRAGNLRAGWDAIPKSYQRDVNDVVHVFAANMDPELWKAGMVILQTAAQVMKKRKQLIFAHSKFAAGPAALREPVEKNWEDIADVLSVIASSELADLEKLRRLEVGAFLDGTGKKLTDKLRAIQKDFDPAKLAPLGFPGVPANATSLADLPDAKVSTVRVAGDAATLRIESEDETKDVEYVRVEGKWLPRKAVDAWPDAITTAKQTLTTAMPEQLKHSKRQVLAVMNKVQEVLDQMLAAQTEHQFNQVVDGILQLMAPSSEPGGYAPAKSTKDADVSATEPNLLKPGASPYMPTKRGTRWVYTRTTRVVKVDFTEESIVEIGGQEKVGDLDCLRLDTIHSGTAEKLGAEHLFVADSGVFRCTLRGKRVDPPVLILKFPVEPGARWKASFRVDGITGESIYATSQERVVVPAGTFDAMRVQIVAGTPGVGGVRATNWYAKGIGLVKSREEKPALQETVDVELKEFIAPK